MSYYFSRTIPGSFDDVLERVIQTHREDGFGILTDIDVKQTVKKKLEEDFPKHRILGACNPSFAHKALQEEEKIGLFLPCNGIVQESGENEGDVAVIDPVKTMAAVQSPRLGPVARQVRDTSRSVLNRIPETINS